MAAGPVRQQQRRPLVIGKPGVAPLQQSEQHGIKVAALARQAIFEAVAAVGIGYRPNNPLPDQALEPPGQDVGRHQRVALDVVEAIDVREHRADDERCPAIAEQFDHRVNERPAARLAAFTAAGARWVHIVDLDGAAAGQARQHELIGELARAHDLWIVSDEVYEDMVFDGVPFASPLDLPELAERTVVTSSISKSHAAPGFRSGWCVGPAEFCARLLPLSETMLFGSQPFIADLTELAVSEPSPVAAGMAETVVDLLEVIEVEHRHAQFLVVAARLLQ